MFVMKKSIKSTCGQLPHDRKSSCSIFRSFTAWTAGLAFLRAQSNAIALAGQRPVALPGFSLVDGRREF